MFEASLYPFPNLLSLPYSQPQVAIIQIPVTYPFAFLYLFLSYIYTILSNMWTTEILFDEDFNFKLTNVF